MCRHTHSWDSHFKLRRLNIQASFPLVVAKHGMMGGRQPPASMLEIGFIPP